MSGKCGEESLKSCYAIYQQLEKNWISGKTTNNSDFYKCALSCRVCVCVCVLVTELYLTLCDPMDCSPPGSSIHGTLQVRILEWVAIPFSRGSSWPRDQTLVSCIAGRCFTTWTTREAPIIISCMAPHSSTLAWKIPWMEEPGRLQSIGSLRVRHDWATSLSLSTFMHWRRKWQPTPVFLPGESQGQGSLVGCRLWGRTESDTTEAI